MSTTPLDCSPSSSYLKPLISFVVIVTRSDLNVVGILAANERIDTRCIRALYFAPPQPNLFISFLPSSTFTFATAP
jgi:hypothetical protein